MKTFLPKLNLQFHGLKNLNEQKNEKVTALQAILANAKVENRAMSEEESTQFETLEKEIKSLENTIAAETRARALEITEDMGKEPNKVEERAVIEERAFENYIRGVVEERADVSLTKTDNGAVIPASIANKIIKRVNDICPIYQRATKYNVGGSLSIPTYDESTQAITMAYASEFTDLESTSGKFTSITLTGFLAGVLTKISKSLINNSQFAIVPYTINAMADTISRWIEKELLKGTTNKIDGLKGVTLTQTAAATTAVTADEIIQLKDKVKDAFQQDAMFIMSPATRTALRLLKDTTGKYLLNDDVTSPFGSMLLGKPVYVSDQMDDMAAGKTAIYYGDFAGLAVKLSEDVNLQVLHEKYATQHAVGVVGWIEIDSKVENTQKIAKLTMKAS